MQTTKQRTKARSRARQSKESQLAPSRREENKSSRSRYSSPQSHLKITTREERKRREKEEMCAKHQEPIIAYDEETRELVCEKCIFDGGNEKLVMTAALARGINKALNTEISNFKALIKEFKEIDEREIKRGIENRIATFFQIFREKVDEIEKQTVEKIQGSSNLDNLYDLLDGTREKLDDRLESKYDKEKREMDDKLNNTRFTYICQNKVHFDNVIDQLQDDNKLMRANIARVNKLKDDIFSIATDEVYIENQLGKVAAVQMFIDGKRPVFSASQPTLSQLEDFVPDRVKIEEQKREEQKREELEESDETEPLPSYEAEDPAPAEKEDFMSEQMNSYYYLHEEHLCVKEIEGNMIEEKQIMPVRLHLQRVITVPDKEGNRVFLVGGAKDPEGKHAIGECFEVDIEEKKLIKIDSLSSTRTAMASCITPDCSAIIIAGGCEEFNRPTNYCDIFDIKTGKWKKLPSLNLPRFSASALACTGGNLYCFGGIESNPEDPSRFLCLKSIEWLKYDDPKAEWESLKITIPFKTSSTGAICMGDRTFLIFGGWEKTHLKKSAYIWYDDKNDNYRIEEGPSLAECDNFVSNGLTLRNPKKKTTLIFGNHYCHQYDEVAEKFSKFG